MDREKRRDVLCTVLGRTVEVVEVYVIEGCGACGLSSGLSDLHCSGEHECRRKGLYKDCLLTGEYADFFG